MRTIWGILTHLKGAGVVVGALLSIGSVVLDALGIAVLALPPYVWTAIGLVIFFVAAVAIIVALRRENRNLTNRLNQIISSCPNLELGDVPAYVDVRPIYGHDMVLDSELFLGEPFFAHARFRNNPKIRSAEATAKDVVAEMRFFDSEGNQVLPMLYGRWGDTPQPSTLTPYAPVRGLYPVDFEVSGLHRELDIALKYADEDVCYAFNNDSYWAPKWKKPEFILHGERFQVRIRLVGQMVDREWCFTLHNLGQNQGLTIEVSGQTLDRQASAIQEVE